MHRATHVALLAEGVDRNILPLVIVLRGKVALLAEGVDRNLFPSATAFRATASPSSRRAWIEIFFLHLLPSESSSRPPRGGRG